MIGKSVKFEAVPKNSVGADVTSGGTLFQRWLSATGISSHDSTID